MPIEEIIYNWNCNTVDVYPTQGEFTNVVYNVHYIVTGGINYSGKPIIAKRSGTQSLSTIDAANFIPFDQLTSENIIAWTKSAMGEDFVAALESDIADDIELLKNPATVTMIVPDPPPPAPPIIENPPV